jgi:hypothetical protein
MGAYDTPSDTCPYCGASMEADWVDVGVGMVQCGPYHCYACGASEIGPELSDWYYKDREGNVILLPGRRKYFEFMKKKGRTFGKTVLKPGHPFTEEELKHGYYKGNISPYANTINGHLVGHRTAKAAYELGLLDDK